MSAKFSTLVDKAEHFLTKMPWDTAFEKDKFTRPDFTALCVCNFVTSGLPAGINLPNYDDVKDSNGFKNVSLSNVLSSTPSSLKVTFLTPEDEELYKKLQAPAFEVQVALHGMSSVEPSVFLIAWRHADDHGRALGTWLWEDLEGERGRRTEFLS